MLSDKEMARMNELQDKAERAYLLEIGWSDHDMWLSPEENKELTALYEKDEI